MKKPYLLAILSLLAWCTINSFFTSDVKADGMMIESFEDRWDYSTETDQQAFINFENGVEKMILSVSYSGGKSDGVIWLFPIPADPNKVTIDIASSLPNFQGENISLKAKSNVERSLSYLQVTQFYPFFFEIYLISTERGKGDAAVAPFDMNGQDINQNVVVYEHLEKEGLTSEIITAKTANDLYDYLAGKGLAIESGVIPVLDHYVGQEYAFVATWISSPNNAPLSRSKGVYVTFPTKDIYFPLLPTSVYGSKIIPATIRIIGYVSPKIFQDIENYTEIAYFDGFIGLNDELENFYSDPMGHVTYTVIQIRAPSKLLTDDLWIKNTVPLKTYYALFFGFSPVITFLFLLIISSLISALFTGVIIFPQLRSDIGSLVRIGFYNCFSIFGVLIATILIKTRKIDESIEPVLNEIRQKGYFWKRKLAIILLVANFPFFLLLSFILINYRFDMPFLVPTFILFVVWIFSHLIKRIKPEDVDLFKQLTKNKYSWWSFHAQDNAKIVFVPAFSIVFLIVSWSLVKLIEHTV